MCRCLVVQCPYNTKGFCSSRETIIGQDGICTHLKSPRWQEPAQYQKEVNVITLAKREEKKDEENV